MDETADQLSALLHSTKHPNCTLYLIWHYVRQGNMEYARSEFARDSDKLGRNREAVSSILEMTDEFGRTAQCGR